jgi:S1-C subfamily serine protease
MRRLAALTLLSILASSTAAGAQGVGQLYDNVSASVVVIKAKGREVSSAGTGLVNFGETGSGVLISADGKVITASHVVQAMDEIEVEFLGVRETVPARVIASEPAADLSLLQLQRVPSGVQAARLGDSDKARVGHEVIVIGAPYGLSHSLTTGYISARWAPNTVYRRLPFAEFFQTNAAINTGNSGGPMFNMTGEVIGIVSHIISKSGGSEGLGFVVTVNTAKRFLLTTDHFWSGMEGELISGAVAAVMNVPQPVGFLVTAVAKNSPSALAGVRGGTLKATISGQEYTVGGDVILKIADITLTAAADMVKMREKLGALPAGSPYAITLLRGGKVIELTGRVP